MQGLDASPILLNNSRQNTETIKNETEVQSFTLEENPFEVLVTEIPEPKSLKTQKTPNNSYLIQPCSSHLETISELTQQNKLLQQKIRESREKLLKSEENVDLFSILGSAPSPILAKQAINDDNKFIHIL